VTFVFPRAGVVVLHDDVLFRLNVGLYKPVNSLSTLNAVVFNKMQHVHI